MDKRGSGLVRGCKYEATVVSARRTTKCCPFSSEDLIALAASIKLGVRAEYQENTHRWQASESKIRYEWCFWRYRNIWRIWKGELLDKEHIRTLDLNYFDIIPTRETMEQVAVTFWTEYTLPVLLNGSFSLAVHKLLEQNHSGYI